MHPRQKIELVSTQTALCTGAQWHVDYFEKLDAKESPEECLAIVQQTLGELKFTPRSRKRSSIPPRGGLKDKELLDEAEIEHMTAKMLIEQLKGMTAEDEKFAAMFKVLGPARLRHDRTRP